MKVQEVPIWEKAALTIDEAAEYSNIGTKKLRELARNPRNAISLMIGNRTLIKRKALDELIERELEV